MSIDRHRWEFFDRAEIGKGPNDRHVRLPARRACTICGVTEILERDLTDYPHVIADAELYPNKLRLAR